MHLFFVAHYVFMRMPNAPLNAWSREKEPLENHVPAFDPARLAEFRVEPTVAASNIVGGGEAKLPRDAVYPAGRSFELQKHTNGRLIQSGDQRHSGPREFGAKFVVPEGL